MARKNISSQKRSGAKTVVEVNKGAWTTEEDQKLVNYVTAHGYKNWRSVPLNAGLNRCGKSCRMRWPNYLRPGIKRGNITEEEEDLIIRLHNLLGNRWALIAGRIPGRTDNEIKNHWNTQLNERSLTIEDLNLKHHSNATPPTLNLGGITTPPPITISAPLDDHRLIPNPILMSSSSSNTTTTTDDAQSQGFVLPDSDFNFEQLLNCPPDHSRGSSGSELGLMDDYYCINDDDGNFNYDGYYLQDHLFKFTGCDVSSNSGCLEYSSEQLMGHDKSDFDDVDQFLNYQDRGLCFSDC